MGGRRGANWAVLREFGSGRTFITGGIHTSANMDKKSHHVLEAVQRAELGWMYNRFEEMKRKYPEAPVIWMGDLNAKQSGHVISDLFKGKIGDRAVFPVEDVLKVPNGQFTWLTGGVIDYILADTSVPGVAVRRGPNGGWPVRVRKGNWLKNADSDGKKGNAADHFPVYAELYW
jgi:endonuclease/exonuclease/phosphatase family metal-dependent hydrolase